MGSGNSKPFRKGKKSRNNNKNNQSNMVIGAPQDVITHIPRNRLDKYGNPVQQVTRDIDRGTFSAALQHVSDYIASRRQHITVVAVGGAVNILHLRSRATTHDCPAAVSDSTETQMWMPGPIHEHLTAASKQQNVVVFNGAGLTIYAAPWEYAFSAKASRLIKGGEQVRSYDLADAVTYIHQYILLHGNRPVSVDTVLGWARQYKHETSKSFCAIAWIPSISDCTAVAMLLFEMDLSRRGQSRRRISFIGSLLGIV
ncbi:hypothetical protein SPBR_08944 [Sporothrix brasiliensis 5110]|uniref:Uncharacterized protein n=1 Tax=Sporothrix brasiliensis 5110 TaxID=1398154 RepID=A0A0C2IKA0_9PEZI|nr:uncharacterized protein SPBR_08944 [Sporothrix brasiliensis 5110]KIH87415.1 hypothetical protein SPBR_08944 [Sporothrix brasiliensis 5110]